MVDCVGFTTTAATMKPCWQPSKRMVCRNSCELAEEGVLFPLDDLSVISYDQNTSVKIIWRKYVRSSSHRLLWVFYHF